MAKYRVSITVEAPDLSAAVGRFLYDDAGESERGFIAIEAEEWDI